MEAIKRFVKKLVYKEKADSDTYVRYLRKIGCKIGSDVTVYVPTKTLIDITRPFLIDIGDHVRITEGVTILTHGYDWSVLKGKYGDVLGSSGAVTIGNNVFIGMHSTILKSTHIGNNVIIGANSLVTKDIPDDVVAAGNPCKVIMTIEEYHQKRINAQLSEAKELVEKYRERYGKEPGINELREFFWLFENDYDKLHKEWKSVIRLGDNEVITKKVLKENQPLFNGIHDFLSHV